MLGVIADDFTGATDIGDRLVEQGFRTVVLPGLQAGDPPEDADALVVALKSRTAPRDEAVAASLEAYELLEAAGCRRFYFKYCSTFDSTSEGNIGPVIDALLDRAHAAATVVAPAYPDAGRTVYQGHLFVGDQLLSESSMRHHPLTPMTDSDLRRLLAPQTELRIVSIPLATVRAPGELASALEGLSRGEGGDRVAVVVDAIATEDLRVLARATSAWPLLTGSAGLVAGLDGPRPGQARDGSLVAGRRVVVCGSASAVSRTQVAVARDHMPARQIDLGALSASPDAEAGRLVAWSESKLSEGTGDMPLLVYASGPGDDLHPGLSEAVEECLADVVRRLVRDAGVRQVLVGGGETSAAVTRRLEARRLTLGPSIATGVPWMVADLPEAQINLALKSGNFGPPDMFVTAWDALGG